jgi:hypothetical protein
MKKTTLILLLSLPFITLAQVGIGTTSPNTSSVLELMSNDKGLLVPRMTDSERQAINPALASTFTNPEESTKGLLVYQTDNAEGFYYFDGTIWQLIGDPANKDNDWTIVGDDIYNANSGNVGVGVTTPVAKFHVKSSGSGTSVFRLEDTQQQNGYVLISDADGNAYWDDIANAALDGIQKLSLSGFDLSISDANTVDLSPVFTDDQKIDKLNLTNSDILEIAIEDDNVADETIDLSSLVGTDNQTIDEFKLTGSILSLSLLNDGVPSLTLDIAAALLSQYDFENALKKVTNDVKLGGPLTKNTTIDVNDENFILLGDNKKIFEANGDKDFIMFGGATAVPYTNFSFAKPADGDIYNDTFGRDYRIDIVAGFRSLNGTIDAEGGSAIQIGDEEFIVDGKEELMVNSNFSSLFNDNFGTDTFKWTEVYTVNGVNSTSDMTLKTNVKNLEKGLEEILELRTITYQWKADKKGIRQAAGNSKERKIGFSAQQLQAKIPEVVNTHSWVPADEKGNFKYKQNKNLGVYYNDLIPVQVKAIQEQQQEIKELELLISNLENTISSLKNK